MRRRDSEALGPRPSALGSRPSALGSRRVELVARTLGLFALVVLLALTLLDLRRGPRVLDGRASGLRALRAELPRWTARAPARAAVGFDSMPTPAERAWLTALASTGTRVSWRGDSLARVAIAVEPVADPTRPTRVLVAAPDSSALSLRDALGPVDSVAAGAGGAAIVVPRTEGVVHVAVNGAEATASPADSLALRRILVLGRAGWEAKFVAAALAERGWVVDARLAVSPAGDALLGAPPASIDTARYAAVVVLDSTGARSAERIAAFVRAGGGLIVSGEGARVRGLATLLAAPPGATATEEGRFAADTAHPRGALARLSSGALVAGATILERDEGAPAVLARRVGAGRVLQSAYVDTWRWRMGGVETDPVAAHRVWWSSLVSAVAYAPRVTLASASTEPTPYASLVERLGAPSSLARVALAPSEPAWLRAFLFSLGVVALLVEWASRRLRGAR